ncbi:MAG: NMD3-related protein [Candidatus Aenigmatarchaeota archaeon]
MEYNIPSYFVLKEENLLWHLKELLLFAEKQIENNKVFKMKRICILCGAAAEKGNFCKQCILLKNKLFEIKDFRIIMCRNGDNYYLAKWKEFTNENAMLKDAIAYEMKGNVDNFFISFRPFKCGFKVKIRGVGKIQGFKKEEETEIEVSIKRKMCEDCIKVSGRYHEAKMQIRGDMTEYILGKVMKLIPKTAWVEDNKHGYDLFFLTKGEAAQIAKYLRARHDVIKSFKVVGNKKGTLLMRDVYSVK